MSWLARQYYGLGRKESEVRDFDCSIVRLLDSDQKNYRVVHEVNLGTRARVLDQLLGKLSSLVER